MNGYIISDEIFCVRVESNIVSCLHRIFNENKKN